ncbi:MAG TPA: Ldh family oxidoreductase [Bacillota bacterium]|nr:MAG: putative oxidoreductase YjmC [Firmicutes bacterium ADurb.Bin153]HNV33996.1 Ldh family oxidoreductase [Bacillota bacterium]
MKIDPIKLGKAAAAILVGLGEDPEDSLRAAECLVYADMTGISTHGTYLMKTVYERAKAGMLNLPTGARLVSDSAATAIVDGNNGLGPVAGTLAMDTAVKKARDFGVGVVLVRNTNNVGCLGYYTKLAAKAGMVGLMACNANASMAPWGGAQAYFGTNPISLSVPVEKGHPVVLDMASSIVARGKIRKASREKARIPEGWALNREGRPTTDPDEALGGTLLPIGGPKGSGLAMVVDLVAGMLSGASYGPSVRSFHSLDGPTGVGTAFLAMDPARFMDPSEYKGLVDAYIEDMKGTRRAAGFSSIFSPGEIEAERWESSRVSGVELDDPAVSTLNGLLAQVGSNILLGGLD